MYHWTKSCCCCCMQCAHILLLLLLLLIYVTNANGSGPKYETVYACESKQLTIECGPGDLINLIRANYGRFSITICNDHGNVDWSVNCMSPGSLNVLASRCAHRQSCTVMATTSMFGDDCPGTHKYLEAHYVCISASQTTTTTTMRPTPPWLRTPLVPPLINGNTSSSVGGGGGFSPPVLPSPSPLPPHYTVQPPRLPSTVSSNGVSTVTPHLVAHTSIVTPTTAAASDRTSTDVSASSSSSSNTRILNGASHDEGGGLLMTSHNRFTPTDIISTNSSSLASTMSTDFHSGSTIRMLHNNNNNNHNNNNNNNNNNNADGITQDNSSNNNNNNFYCGPTNARNLFWNITRVSDVNVQPCPGGASGIAKWRCVLMKRTDMPDETDDEEAINAPPEVPTATPDCRTNNVSSSICNNQTLAIRLSKRLRNYRPVWHPHTPDLTQCRSPWLNTLEISVNQGDSSLISIANDLSEVTSSQTLYGGDMLVTTKIIQTMSEKMFHDKETFPDQRQREAVILEFLHGVVKTGSNLLDGSQLASWLDLNQEDQMRVATSLLTGLEYSAFLLADTIIRERNVVQKVKNILLTVRVLETKNIQAYEIFPDAEQWPISDDRIEIPRAALVENSEAGLVRVVFAAFDRLESILKPSYDHFDDKSARNHVRNTVIINNDTVTDAQQQRVRILNSKVISASLGKGRHTQLSQPIKLVLRHLRTQNVTNPTCVFWNYIDHAWSENGCSLESTNRTHSICMCNHLTNFAILMDIVNSRGHSLFGMFDGNMRILIYVSVGICLIFILIALLTLKLFNGGIFMKSARTAIYRSIYLCLLFIEILFILGIELTESSMFCCFTTVLLHCSILAGIAWFCFEAYQSYTTLTTDDMLLDVDQSAKVHCYYLLSYGLSLTIVAISSLINPSAYTKNDFCVLMEANVLFYVTFLAPVFIFLIGALLYTFLSWIIMCRKSRSALKNKEHTRLANVRFDLRCYFVFVFLLIGVWTSAYNYLRRSKLDDDSSNTYGYLFVGFNTLMGLFMFVFHCIQNEKIRREYGKYVRNHSWLPRCLRCSKTSIASGVVAGGSGGGGGGAASAGGTLTSHAAIVTSTNHIFGGTHQSIKAKISPHILVGAESGNIISAADIVPADDAIMSSSDCELNESQVRRTAAGTLVTPIMDNCTIKSGVLPGSLNLQQQQQQQQVVLECNTNGSGSGSGAGASAATTGTLRSIGGGVGGLGLGNPRTPSIGHASPTSSVSSSQLIFAHGQKQVATPDGYYHQPDFYNWQKGKMRQNGLSPQHYPSTAPQTHEFFYWTQKHNQHGKKKRSGGGNGSTVATSTAAINNGTMPESPSGSLHSRTTAGSQILYYPSYKKTTTSSTMKNQMTPQQKQQQQYSYAHYAEAMEPYYQSQQQPRRVSPHAQQQYYLQQQQQQLQQQVSSDDEQMESHAQLLHLNRRGAGPTANLTALQLQQQQQHQMVQPMHYQQHHAYATADYGPSEQQRYYRNKQSNCDLSQQHQLHHQQQPTLDYNGLGVIGGDFYHHGSTGSDAGGPVYEEILSNRITDGPHYDEGVGIGGGGGVGVGDMHEQDLDAGRRNTKRNTRRRRKRRTHVENEREGERDMESESACDDMNDGNDMVAINHDNDLNGHQYDDDDNGVGAIDSMARADERMRRLMELEDENFRRRFQRQQKSQTVSEALRAPYHNFDGQNAGGVFSGGGDSVRSFKKTSPNGRLAVNDLFNQVAPPLPPANQKRQTPQKQSQQQLLQQQQQLQLQQHFQQLSPKSVNNGIIGSGAQQQQVHPIGRNISAMLDENNTVRCYLEPLKK